MDEITMVFYDCIICGEKVGCYPNTPEKERICSHHTKEEIAEKTGEGK